MGVDFSASATLRLHAVQYVVPIANNNSDVDAYEIAKIKYSYGSL